MLIYELKFILLDFLSPFNITELQISGKNVCIAKLIEGIFFGTYLELSTIENCLRDSLRLHFFNNFIRVLFLRFILRLLFNFCLAGLNRFAILRYTLFNLTEEV